MSFSPWRKSTRSANQGACVEARLAYDSPPVHASEWHRSSHSASGGNCVEARVAYFAADADSEWRKSSRSAAQEACVEARLSHAVPQLSDSKLPDDRPILTLDRDTFTGLLSAIKSGTLT